MKKTLIPRGRSEFLLISCKTCESQKIVFSHSTTEVRCPNCDTLLVKPTGGRARIFGAIVKRLS